MEAIGPVKEGITSRFLEAADKLTKNYQFRTQKEFAESISVGNHHMSNLGIGKSHVNAWMISLMVEKYPEINPDYILYGRGKLFRDVPDKFKTKVDMWEYIESLQDENNLLKKQIELLQRLLLEKKPS